MTIRTSEKSKKIITMLTSSFSLGAENVIARIAIVYSLKNFYEDMDFTVIDDSKGKEYSNKVLFGSHEKTYVGIICFVHKIRETSPLLPKIIKFHLDRGLHLLEDYKNDRPRISTYEFINGLHLD